MAFQQDLSCDLRMKFQSREYAHAREMHTKVNRRHANEASLAVHDAIIMGKGERAPSAKGMPRDKSDRWKREV
jgi:hypothetical protein